MITLPFDTWASCIAVTPELLAFNGFRYREYMDEYSLYAGNNMEFTISIYAIKYGVSIADLMEDLNSPPIKLNAPILHFKLPSSIPIPYKMPNLTFDVCQS